jgi:hypothetical protein
MPDTYPRIIFNSLSRPCSRCTGVHEYITRLSDDATCDTPVAFSAEKAKKLARLVAQGDQDVRHVSDDMLIVMDSSARKLPRTDAPVTRLAQFELSERSM